MKLDVYQVDAFASKVFEGNPAAVIPLQSWLSDELMQAIAEENNLSETVFFVKEGDVYRIRWFTPVTEVDLCGHATLASAFVMFEELGIAQDKVEFISKSGPLTVEKNGNLLVLNFPSNLPAPCEIPPKLSVALGATPQECYQTDDLIAVFEDEMVVRGLAPDFAKLAGLDCRGVIVTSQAKDYDFVSRFFAPQSGIDEDPVTGSAFTKLVPLWAEKLDKTRFEARQVSSRGGDVTCELAGDRVLIAGSAVMFLRGTIEIDG
jgi:PhzF family phenazine biosynthesis protein